eukprot:scaffold7396_cov387-Prasinococcus_capsulatus_cf.AAC.2
MLTSGLPWLCQVLYPLSHILHPHGFMDRLAEALPAGVSGAIGVVRNWTFSLYYVFAELWGDVVISLLFWGLANETCTRKEANTLYPLFGLGANIAVVFAGILMKALGSGAIFAGSSFAEQLVIVNASVVVCALLVAMVHYKLCHQVICRLPGDDVFEADTPLENKDLKRHTLGEKGTEANGVQEQGSMDSSKKTKEAAPSVAESLSYLAGRLPLRCLAIMAVGQGVTFALLTVAWKNQMQLTFPEPAAYSAAMGDVSAASGLMTVALMLVSPYIFRKFGWLFAAQMTPVVMLFGGVAFLIGSMIWSFAAKHPVLQTTPIGSPEMLLALTVVGAALYVFLRGAKFALFKPAEEMVYIQLDRESKTTGKAAIDVVGAQMGKTGGSLLQQGLLILLVGAHSSDTACVLHVQSFVVG